MQWGIQVYGVRDFMTTEEDVRETFSKLRTMGYTQIQTAGCMIPYKKYGELAKEAGLEIVGTHDDFNMMLNDFERSLENHRLLGTTNMGIGGKAYTSLEDVERFIEDANTVAQRAAANGMKFTYHNHSGEFRKWENGKTTMEMLIDGFDKENVSFVLDTYWVQNAGGDVREYIEMLEGRIDILHLKDMMVSVTDSGVVRAITEIGNGNMNWKGILDSAKKTGVKYYIVEQDGNWKPNCFAAAKASIEYLKKI